MDDLSCLRCGCSCSNCQICRMATVYGELCTCIATIPHIEGGAGSQEPTVFEWDVMVWKFSPKAPLLFDSNVRGAEQGIAIVE